MPTTDASAGRQTERVRNVVLASWGLLNPNKKGGPLDSSIRLNAIVGLLDQQLISITTASPASPPSPPLPFFVEYAQTSSTILSMDFATDIIFQFVNFNFQTDNISIVLYDPDASPQYTILGSPIQGETYTTNLSEYIISWPKTVSLANSSDTTRRSPSASFMYTMQTPRIDFNSGPNVENITVTDDSYQAIANAPITQVTDRIFNYYTYISENNNDWRILSFNPQDIISIDQIYRVSGNRFVVILNLHYVYNGVFITQRSSPSNILTWQ